MRAIFVCVCDRSYTDNSFVRGSSDWVCSINPFASELLLVIIRILLLLLLRTNLLAPNTTLRIVAACVR